MIYLLLIKQGSILAIPKKMVEYRKISPEEDQEISRRRREQARLEAEAEAFEIKAGGVVHFASNICKEELRREGLPKYVY